MSKQPELPLNGKNGKVKPAEGAKKPRKLDREMATAFDGRGESDLKKLVDQNFLDYASYVIKDRAIPNLEDGLKPVQRRIMHALKLRDDGKLIKVANIVGFTMQFHPHGDASIADALVNIANKNYLIEGQGNYGNIYTGDPAAASRYIECRLTELARTQLFNKNLTRFMPSYDGRNEEPVLLPAKIPMLLMHGTEGIAVGLSTKILPHNFIELVEGMINSIQKKPIGTILPDFQQGGSIDASEYEDGQGKVKVRAVIEKKDKSHLIIRELPFGTTTESLISSVENAIRRKKLKVRSISDFTAEKVEIQITLSPGEDQDKMIQALYGLTDCEISLSSNLLALKENRPTLLTVTEVVKFYAKQLKEILEKELEWEKNRLLDEFHNKTLVQLFVENRVYKLIEECKTYEEVQKAVLKGMNKFRKKLKRDISTDDIEMLLGIRIKKISRFDINKSQKDIGDVLDALKEVEANLKQLTRYSVRYLKALIKKYKDQYPRRTKVESFEHVELREITASECKLYYDPKAGYMGDAVKGEELFACSSLDRVMIVWKDGRYKISVPPDKLFVGKDMLYCAVYDREKVMTCVYTSGGVSYFKKFTFGGCILNKDYLLAPPKSKVILFDDTGPDQIFVKYKVVPKLRIKQQIFNLKDLSVKGAKAKGNQMTVKAINNLGTKVLKNWDDADTHETNAEMMDF